MKKQTGPVMYSIVAKLEGSPEHTVIALHNLNVFEVRAYLNKLLAEKTALKDGDTYNLLWDVFYTKDMVE